MTYEPMHSAQEQSVRVKEKNFLDLSLTIVALQKVSLIPYVLSYRSVYS